MSVVINTNYAATVASNNLAASNQMLQKSLNRLSSGSKIVNPSDDAGGLAVSMKLSAAAKRSGAAATNIGNSVSFLQTQDGVLKVAGKVLDRISELKTLYSDPTKNADDKANYDAEFSQLQKQLTSLTGEKFNDVALFGSTDLSVQVSEDGTQSVSPCPTSPPPSRRSRRCAPTTAPNRADSASRARC
jgi:flagellin